MLGSGGVRVGSVGGLKGPAATDMGCKNANRIVEFTTLFEPFLTSFSVEPQVSQYSNGKLMELASSRCHRHGLKAKYGSMPRWRAEVEVNCTFTRPRRGPMGTLRTRTCCAYCRCSGCHVACFLGCYRCRVELPTGKYSLNTSITHWWRAEDLFMSVVVVRNLRLQHATSFLQRKC